jgi:hypothetical protein
MGAIGGSAFMGVGGDSALMPLSRAGFALLYNRGALVVRLVDRPSGDTDVADYEMTDLSEDSAVPTQVRVRVTYLFHCAVPLANRLMCHDPLDLAFGAGASAARTLASGPINLETLQRFQRQYQAAQDRQDREAVGIGDLEEGDARAYLGAFALISLTTGMGPYPRMKVMSAEAQLPIHYANYQYGS